MLLGLAGFVVGIYVVVVLGGGALIGHTDSPSVPLSVLATTVVALLFARVQAALERATTRWGRGAATPYDVLSHFSEAVTSAYATDELPTRMAMLLAQGTGAKWAQVWLTVSDRLTLAATWPANIDADRTPPSLRPEDIGVTRSRALRALPVRHGGQLLGVLRLQERPGLALTLVEERLFSGLAAQAGLVLRWVGLRAELDDRRAELLVRSEEIKASRERLIETQDAERSRLERDLHDGAQQHLVALTVNLRLAHTILDRSPERAAALLTEQAVAALTAIESLSSLSRGIYPRQLADEGLEAALRSAVAGSPIPVTIDATAWHDSRHRSRPRSTSVAWRRYRTLPSTPAPTRCRCAWARTGTGGSSLSPMTAPASTRPSAAAASGAGLANMRDRLDAVGGTVELASMERIGTTVTAVVPRTEVAVRAGGTMSLRHRVV